MNHFPSEAAPPPHVPLPELIVSLEQAALMAKQLPATADPTHLLQIYSSLHQAHKNLTFFLPQTQIQPQFPSFPPPDISLSSTTGAGGNEPMEVGDDGEDYEGGDSKATTIDKVEEKLRGCFIKNKRVKRPLSPSLAAEERRLIGDGDFDSRTRDFDPRETRMRALDLIYQFHA